MITAFLILYTINNTLLTTHHAQFVINSCKLIFAPKEINLNAGVMALPCLILELVLDICLLSVAGSEVSGGDGSAVS